MIFVSAGEPSGDFLGAQLIKALKIEFDEKIEFIGIGGPLMQAEGLTTLFPMEELSVMGFTEILSHARHVLKRVNQTVNTIQTLSPEAVITIDSPGFNFRVAKKLRKCKGHNPLLIHYVAPSVWAWRPGRAKKIAAFLDHLLVLFPFEPPYFTEHNLPTTFVGHPIVELTFGTDFRSSYKISEDEKLVVLLPGSRRSEIERMMPVFVETINLLDAKKLHVVIPTLPHLLELVKSYPLKFQATIITDQTDKLSCFQAADAALATSGTVSLELAATQTPMIIAYKVSKISHWIAKKLVKIKFMCLVNILLNKPVVPEFVQEACNPEVLATELTALLENAAIKASLQKEFADAISMLHPQGSSPSAEAAKVVRDLVAGAGFEPTTFRL